MTPIELPCYPVLHEAALIRTSLSTFHAVLQKHPFINSQDSHGNTPLHYAASQGFYDKVLLLIKEGASVDPVNKEGLTPLYVSVWRWLRDNHTEISCDSQVNEIKKLASCLTTKSTQCGETPLLTTIAVLIQNGANPLQKNQDGLSVIDYCLHWIDIFSPKPQD